MDAVRDGQAAERLGAGVGRPGNAPSKAVIQNSLEQTWN
jgi:hypothetical protein